MKNKFTVFVVLVVLTVAALGCGSFNPFNGSKETGRSSSTTNENTATDEAVDTTAGGSRIGVPECDEVMDLVQAEMNNADDDYVTKAIKATVLNRIKDGIRDSVEKNKQDTTEMAKTCREFKRQFDKYKAEDSAKKGQ